jgi:hypothetical protein
LDTALQNIRVIVSKNAPIILAVARLTCSSFGALQMAERAAFYEQNVTNNYNVKSEWADFVKR